MNAGQVVIIMIDKGIMINAGKAIDCRTSLDNCAR